MSNKATMVEGKLSQREIELLIESFGSNQGRFSSTSAAALALRGKTIKVYDFRRPDKFSKDHLRALRIVNRSYARLLTTSLTSYLRTGAQVRAAALDQLTYDEYIRTLASPTVTYQVSLSPLAGQAVLELNLPVARAILDRLLGGPGIPSARAHDMTEIELALLQKVGGVLMSAFREAWGNVVRLQPNVQEPVLTPEFVHVTLPGETTVVLSFELALPNITGTFTICLPHPVLQPVLEALTSQVWVAAGPRQDADDDGPADHDQLARVDLPVTALLGETDITLRDLLALSEGTILKLDTAAGGALPIRVGEYVKFLGRPGMNGKNLAIKIERVITG